MKNIVAKCFKKIKERVFQNIVTSKAVSFHKNYTFSKKLEKTKETFLIFCGFNIVFFIEVGVITSSQSKLKSAMKKVTSSKIVKFPRIFRSLIVVKIQTQPPEVFYIKSCS